MNILWFGLKNDPLEEVSPFCIWLCWVFVWKFHWRNSTHWESNWVGWKWFQLTPSTPTFSKPNNNTQKLTRSLHILRFSKTRIYLPENADIPLKRDHFQKKRIVFQPSFFRRKLLAFGGRKHTLRPPLAIFRLHYFDWILAKLPLTFSRKARDWVLSKKTKLHHDGCRFLIENSSKPIDPLIQSCSPQGLTPWIFTARRRPEPVPAPMPPQTAEAQVLCWLVVRHRDRCNKMIWALEKVTGCLLNVESLGFMSNFSHF